MTATAAQEPAIRVHGLTESYSELEVLRGVDFEVSRGASIFAPARLERGGQAHSDRLPSSSSSSAGPRRHHGGEDDLDSSYASNASPHRVSLTSHGVVGTHAMIWRGAIRGAN